MTPTLVTPRRVVVSAPPRPSRAPVVGNERARPALSLVPQPDRRGRRRLPPLRPPLRLNRQALRRLQSLPCRGGSAPVEGRGEAATASSAPPSWRSRRWPWPAGRPRRGPGCRLGQRLGCRLDHRLGLPQDNGLDHRLGKAGRYSGLLHDLDRLQGLGAGDAVHLEPDLGLEALHRGLGLGAELAVGRTRVERRARPGPSATPRPAHRSTLSPASSSGMSLLVSGG